MDYKEIAKKIIFWAKSCDRTKSGCQVSIVLNEAATAITDLLARAEKAEAENANFQKNRPIYQYCSIGTRELELGAEAISLAHELQYKLKAAEDRAEKAEKQIEAFSMFALGNTVTVSGNREVITFCGVSCDEAMERVTDYPQLKMRLERAEKALSKLQSILYDPLIIEQNGVLRPVKRTSRQDVYKTVLAAQAAAGITGRWFPKWMKEE